jgi:hypothetical protein
MSGTESPSGLEAAMFATLGVNDEGCVVAGSEDGGTTLVWPDGYSVRGDSDSFEILARDGSVVARSGEDLAIGGGAADSSNDAWTNSDCVEGSIWMVGAISSP